jgi:hypothetical protein
VEQSSCKSFIITCWLHNSLQISNWILQILVLIIFVLREGIFLPNQVKTRNISIDVRECFCKLVKESIEQQADRFKGLIIHFNSFLYINNFL